MKTVIMLTTFTYVQSLGDEALRQFQNQHNLEFDLKETKSNTKYLISK